MFLSPPPLNCKELYGPQGIREVVYTLLSLSPTWLCVVNYWQKTGERKNLFDDQDAYAICYIRATCVFQDQTELTKHHLTSIERNGDWQSWQPRGHAGSSPTHTKRNIYEHRDKSKEKLFFSPIPELPPLHCEKTWHSLGMFADAACTHTNVLFFAYL